jgi:hypothetical protein
MKIDREKIVAKVRALLSKTMDNGCTEHEAMAALGKARALMDAYEVTAEDCKLTDEQAEVLSAKHDTHELGTMLGNAIGRFTNCKVWRDSDKSIRFCGLASDTELAVWMLDHLRLYVKLELAKHLKGVWVDKGNRRVLINGFTMGACSRISNRLDELTQASKQRATSNGTALVVAKDALVAAKMATLGLNLRQGRSRARKASHASYAAGQNAGDRASFGRPVGGSGPNSLLGK